MIVPANMIVAPRCLTSPFDAQHPEVDSFWQDDGARSARYSPFFANSGFYFLRANGKTRNFMHAMLVGFDQIMAVRG